MLKKLYVKNSLCNTEQGYEFAVENTLMDATIIEPIKIAVDNRMIPEKDITISYKDTSLSNTDIEKSNPLPLKEGIRVVLSVHGGQLKTGTHSLEIAATTKEFGDIKFSITDSV